jgi:peptidoglycan/LPS O-acetylase OafA/YrhL
MGAWRVRRGRCLFVISGYLIGKLVGKEIREGRFSFARFYSRRAKRILPALLGVIAFTYSVAPVLLSPAELKGLGSSAIGAITSSSNLYFLRRASDYFDTSSSLNPLLMTWTLGVEEQFYFLFPALMILIRNKSGKAQLWIIECAGLVSFAAWIWCGRYAPAFGFYMLPARAWELAAGVVLSIAEINRLRKETRLQNTAANILSDLRAALCQGRMCRFAIGDKMLYRDFEHLSPLGAQIALAKFQLR